MPSPFERKSKADLAHKSLVLCRSAVSSRWHYFRTSWSYENLRKPVIIAATNTLHDRELHEQSHLDGARRRARDAVVSPDGIPLQARGAAGGQVPADRHPDFQLHQQRDEADLRAHAVPLGEPPPPHPPQLCI